MATQSQTSSPIEDLAKERWRYAEAAKLTHYGLSDWERLGNRVLGTTAAVLSAIVSAGLFAALNTSHPSSTWKLSGAVLAAVAGALAALKTALGWGTLADQHHKTGAKLGQVVREIDIFIESKREDNDDSRAELRHMDGDISAVEESAPGYPGRYFRRKYKDVGAWKPPPRQ